MSFLLKRIRSPLKKGTVLFLALLISAMTGKVGAIKGGKIMKEATLDLSGNYTDSSAVISACVSPTAVNTVRPELFGANISWVDDGNGLWERASGKANDTLLQKLQKSGVSMLRYPGGIEGDYFHLNETIGPMTSRQPQINCFSSQYPYYTDHDGYLYPVYFGVEELLSVCESAGIGASIQLNTGNGTAEEALNFVEYLKNSGYLKNVRTLSLGNEACMREERVSGITVTKTPEQYIDFCRPILAGMDTKILNSDKIQVGAIGITPSHPLCAHSDWDRKILSELGSYLDFIDVHIGYSYYFQGDVTDSDAVLCYLASPQWISSLINEEKQLISQYGGKNADKIGIHISEFGPVGGSIPNSLAGSLFLADVYNVFLSEPKITEADYLPLLNHYASAQLLGYKGHNKNGSFQYWDNAASYVFKMYSNQCGRKVLPVTLSGAETFSSPAVGLVPAIDDVPVGSVSAFYDQYTGNGSLFLLNKETAKNTEFKVDLPFEISVTGTTELWSADPTASNQYYAQNVLSPTEYTAFNGTSAMSFTVRTKPVSLVKIDFSRKENSDVLLWSDDFSENSISYYHTAGPDNGAWGTWSVADGSLQVKGNTGASWWGTSCVLNGTDFSDFHLTFDADVSAGYGIILRAADSGQTAGTGLNRWYSGQGYCIMHWVPIESNSSVAVYDYDGSWDGTTVTGPTMLASCGAIGAMRKAHWSVDACGGEITFCITDRENPGNSLIYTLSDSRYKAGNIAFYNLTAAGVTSLKVDNLVITGRNDGDLNTDNVTDVRDLIRLKKRLTDKKCEISRLNLSFLTSGEPDSNTLVGLRRFLLKKDF